MMASATDTPEQQGRPKLSRANSLLNSPQTRRSAYKKGFMEAECNEMDNSDQSSDFGLSPKDNLSDFQREKFTYYFKNFFDSDQDGIISRQDFLPLQAKFLRHTGWDPESDEALILADLNREFAECLQEKAAGTDGQINLNAWLDMWGSLTKGSMGMHNFPFWVQLLPKMMFEVIDKNRDGIISPGELGDFYEKFVGINPDKLQNQTKSAYRAMTANNEYPLDQQLYEQMFANFLLGKNLYGPGKYIFGCFDIDIEPEPFKIHIPVDDEEEESSPPSKPGGRCRRTSSGSNVTARPMFTTKRHLANRKAR